MFNPEISRPAQPNFPVDMETRRSEWAQPFFRKVLTYFRNIWEVEVTPPIVDYPEMYPFRFMMK